MDSRFHEVGREGADGSPSFFLVTPEEGEKSFSTSDLTVRDGIKASVSSRPVSYCFDHTIEDIFDEVERTGRSTVVANIRKRIQEEGCSCETKNPQGGCCLRTVESIIRAAYTRFGGEGNGKGHREETGALNQYRGVHGIRLK